MTKSGNGLQPPLSGEADYASGTKAGKSPARAHRPNNLNGCLVSFRAFGDRVEIDHRELEVLVERPRPREALTKHLLHEFVFQYILIRRRRKQVKTTVTYCPTPRPIEGLAPGRHPRGWMTLAVHFHTLYAGLESLPNVLAFGPSTVKESTNQSQLTAGIPSTP